MGMNARSRRLRLGAITICITAAVAGAAYAQHYGGWGTPVNAEQGSHSSLNTAALEGCPNFSPDGLSLYFASNRSGGMGGLDIYVVRRSSTTEGWGAAVNLGAPINSAADDYCPTPVRGKRLFFASGRSGNGDLFVSRETQQGWQQPTNLGPNINSPSPEFSPSYFIDDADREILYFSSSRPGMGGQDIYQSVNFGPAQLAPGGLNTALDDARPNVRRNGREIVFDRPGPSGGPDIWTASRPSTDDPWPAAVHLPSVSGRGPDTRPALSWDGSMMILGSFRPGSEGSLDLYVTTRPRITGSPGE